MKKQITLVALLLALTLLLSPGICSASAEAHTAFGTGSVDTGSDESAAPQEAPAAAGEAPESLLSSEPYMPEGLEKSVIGLDDRITVVPSQYPYSCIALLDVEAECGCTWTASGFMVSRYGLMTCSHALYCDDHHKPAEYIDFYFGYRSLKDYYYRYDGRFTFWWGDRTQSDFQFDNDYGYVLFQTPVGDTTGWLGTQVLSDGEAKNGVYYNAGYCDGVIKTSSGNMEVYNTKVFKHYLDTEGGYSGSPIFTADYYAVAINVGHNSNNYNIARRIDSNLIERMSMNGLFG